MKNGKTLLLGIFLGILFVLLIIGGIIGYYYYQNKYNPKMIKIEEGVEKRHKVVDAVEPANATIAFPKNSKSENSSYENSEEDDNNIEEFGNRKFQDEEYFYAGEAFFLLNDYDKKEQETFYVNNLKELLNTLGDNRIIYINNPINITQELINITPLSSYKIENNTGVWEGSVSLKYNTQYYELKTKAFFNREELEKKQKNHFVTTSQKNAFTVNDIYLKIKNITNLSIIGNIKNDKIIEIISENNKQSALAFHYVTDLQLKNLTIKHKEYIDKILNSFPILHINNSNLVELEKCNLKNGKTGIYASDVDFLDLESIFISNCTFSALSFTRVYNSYFKNAHITNNDIETVFDLFESNIDINKCTIKNNTTSNFIQAKGEFNRLTFNKECNIKENYLNNWLLNYNQDGQIRIDGLFSIPNVEQDNQLSGF